MAKKINYLSDNWPIYNCRNDHYLYSNCISLFFYAILKIKTIKKLIIEDTGAIKDSLKINFNQTRQIIF